MIKVETIKTFIRKFIEYSGTGSWIYSRRILLWVFDKELVAQLPVSVRFFCAYVRFYIRTIKTPTIIFGHGVFRLTRQLARLESIENSKVSICDQSVWLDFTDPGSLWAVQELSSGSPLQRLIKKLSTDADFFVDVGANQGIFSTIASRTIKNTATVISIEPQPKLAMCIEKTLRSSEVANWKVLNTAVSNFSGSLRLVIPKENKGEAHLSIDTTLEEAATLIQVATLDALLLDVTSNSTVLVKMDIEGAEIDAIKGGRAFFQRCRPSLIVEINPDAMARYNHTVDELKILLGELGYFQWARVEDPERKFPIGSLPCRQCDVYLDMADH